MKDNTLVIIWLLASLGNFCLGYWFGRSSRPATINIVTYRLEARPVPVIQIPQEVYEQSPPDVYQPKGSAVFETKPL